MFFWLLNESWVEDGKCPICCVFNGWILELSSCSRSARIEQTAPICWPLQGQNTQFFKLAASPSSSTPPLTLLWLQHSAAQHPDQVNEIKPIKLCDKAISEHTAHVELNKDIVPACLTYFYCTFEVHRMTIGGAGGGGSVFFHHVPVAHFLWASITSVCCIVKSKSTLELCRAQLTIMHLFCLHALECGIISMLCTLGSFNNSYICWNDWCFCD